MYQIGQEHLDTLHRLLSCVIQGTETGENASVLLADLNRMQSILSEIYKDKKATLDVDVGHGYICAERTFVDGGLEAGIVIGFKEYNGVWSQDFVMVEHPFEESDDGKVVLTGSGVNCYLWGDPDSEDYTCKVHVPKYEA